MAEIKEFIVNDRRKFTSEGEARPDAPPSEPKAPRPETLLPVAPAPDEFNSSARMTSSGPQAVPSRTEGPPVEDAQLSDAPPAPTPEQSDQAERAFAATVERLDTAIRAANPGMEAMPEMNFERVIQSLYMQALMQLGGAAPPGQQPQVDILGARQTIDMLGIIAAKSKGNLSAAESSLVETAVFELHMGFLEVTQAMARQAATRTPGAAPAGPSIVR